MLGLGPGSKTPRLWSFAKRVQSIPRQHPRGSGVQAGECSHIQVLRGRIPRRSPGRRRLRPEPFAPLLLGPRTVPADRGRHPAKRPDPDVSPRQAGQDAPGVRPGRNLRAMEAIPGRGGGHVLAEGRPAAPAVAPRPTTRERRSPGSAEGAVSNAGRGGGVGKHPPGSRLPNERRASPQEEGEIETQSQYTTLVNG